MSDAQDPSPTDQVTEPPGGTARLTRRVEGRMIGGVAGGLADYFGLDPLAIRIGFVALALLGASGLLLYVLGWILIPARGEPDSAAVVAVRATSLKRLAAYGLIALALLLLVAPLVGVLQLGPGVVFNQLRVGPLEFLLVAFASLMPVLLAAGLVYLLIRIVNSGRGEVNDGAPQQGPAGGPGVAVAILVVIGLLLFLPALTGFAAFGARGFVESPLSWSLLLIAVGIALLRRERPASAAPGSPAGVDLSRVPPGGSPASPPGRDAPTTPISAARPPQNPPVAAPRPRRRRSPLGWMGLALALLVAGVAALLDNAGAAALDGASYLALALLMLGATLVVGAFWGRARWLILVGLLLVPLATFLSIIGTPLRGTVGSTYVAPRTVAGVAEGFEILAGPLTLDLTRLAFGSDDVVIPVRIVAGRLTVIVPRGVSIEARGELGAGDLSLLGESSVGLPLEFDETFAAERDTGRLVLEVDGGIGSVTVLRDERFAVDDPRRAEQQERRREARKQARRDALQAARRQRREARAERAAAREERASRRSRKGNR